MARSHGMAAQVASPTIKLQVRRVDDASSVHRSMTVMVDKKSVVHPTGTTVRYRHVAAKIPG